jgi:hypothetical protein
LTHSDTSTTTTIATSVTNGSYQLFSTNSLTLIDDQTTPEAANTWERTQTDLLNRHLLQSFFAADPKAMEKFIRKNSLMGNHVGTMNDEESTVAVEDEWT